MPSCMEINAAYPSPEQVYIVSSGTAARIPLNSGIFAVVSHSTLLLSRSVPALVPDVVVASNRTVCVVEGGICPALVSSTRRKCG